MDAENKHLLIVYHSQSGRNERLAYTAAQAAKKEETVSVRLLRAAEAGTRDLEWADTILLFTPENFGAISGGLKEFLDRIFYPVLARELCRSYGLFICTGNDGRTALVQLKRIFKGLSFREISEPIIVYGAPGEETFEKAAEFGEAAAAGLALGIF